MTKFQGLRDNPRRLLADIQQLEDRAHKLGLTMVAQSLNRAKNVAGWVMAGEPNAAISAMNGKTPT